MYAVPYQHYTNAIENFFSVFKNKLRKCNGIGYKELLKNIKIILKENTYKNILREIIREKYCINRQSLPNLNIKII